jgi:hypothetical protein
MCLFYSSLVLPLDLSVLQQPELTQELTVLQLFVLGCVCLYSAWATPGKMCYTTAFSGPGVSVHCAVS